MKAHVEGGGKTSDLGSGAIFSGKAFAGTEAKGLGSFGLFHYITANIRADDGSPKRVLGGFFAAWVLLFLFLFVVPLPDIVGNDGSLTALGTQGRACLAVMVWACTIYYCHLSCLCPYQLVDQFAVEDKPGCHSRGAGAHY